MRVWILKNLDFWRLLTFFNRFPMAETGKSRNAQLFVSRLFELTSTKFRQVQLVR